MDQLELKHRHFDPINFTTGTVSRSASFTMRLHLIVAYAIKKQK